MDKMKTQDAQLMQASGDTLRTIDDQSSVMGTTPATNSTSTQDTASQGVKRPSWQRPAGPHEWNYSHPQLCAD